MDSEFQRELLNRLNSLDGKLDDVRTKDIPRLREDVATLITENKANSKMHSLIGSIIAIVVSSIIPHR